MQPEIKDNQVNKRILVLGSTPHTRLVKAYTWDKLPQDLNVADYEIIILNLVPLQDSRLTESVDSQVLINMRPQFARAFFTSESEIIAIGIPNTKFGKGFHATWWLPIGPEFVYDSGEIIKGVPKEFEFYFNKVNSYSFHLNAKQTWIAARETNDLGVVSFLDAIDPSSNLIELRVQAIGQTHFGRPVALRLFFKVGQERRDIKNESRAGVYWLPPTTKISNYEAVDLILRERYGLLFEQERPRWVEPYKLPNQLPIEGDIIAYEQKIQDLSEKLEQAKQLLEVESRFQKLLYETGEEILEPVVRNALRELEANVEDPQEKGREDGRLTDPIGRNGMLEIKGRTGTLKLSDVRQLNQWVQDAIVDEENWSSKGILIANLDLNNSPEQRGELFPSNCVKAAQRINMCLMTTTQLFNALCSFQRNELDITDFWNTVFNTNGVCPLPELELPE